MSDFNRKEAMEKLQEIATDYNLKPSILRDVIEGRAQGMTLKDISEMYGHSRNTVSKYSRRIDEEIEEEDLAKLLIVAGILIGGAVLLKKLLEGGD